MEGKCQELQPAPVPVVSESLPPPLTLVTVPLPALGLSSINKKQKSHKIRVSRGFRSAAPKPSVSSGEQPVFKFGSESATAPPGPPPGRAPSRSPSRSPHPSRSPSPIAPARAPGRVITNFDYLLGRIRKYEFRVNKVQTDVIDEFKRQRLPYTVVNISDPLPNPHTFEASIRERAFINGLQLMFTKFKPASFCTVYGSDRERHQWETLSHGMYDAPLYYNYGPNVVARDLTRQGGEGRVNDGVFRHPARLDCLVFLDVFALFDDLRQVEITMSPENVRTFLNGRDAVFIQPRFEGVAGDTYSGAWCRTPAGILARSDQNSEPWPVHAPCDWLHRSGAIPGLQWKVFATVCNVDIILMSCSTPEVLGFDDTPLGMESVAVPTQTTATVMQYVPKWSDYCTQWIYKRLPKKEVLVDRFIFQKCQTHLLAKNRSAFSQKTLLNLAESAMNERMSRAYSWFPRIFDNVHEAAYAAWTFNLEVSVARASTNAFATQHLAGMLNASFESVAAKPQHTSPLPIVARVGVAAGAIYLAYRCYKLYQALSYRFSSASLLDAWYVWWKGTSVNSKTDLLIRSFFILLAPFVEEYYLKDSWAKTVGLGLCEDLAKASFPFWSCWHLFSRALPYHVRLGLHIGWNVAAVIRLWSPALRGPSVWQKWKEAIYVEPWESRTYDPTDPTIQSTAFPPHDSLTPRQDRACYPCVPRDLLLPVSGELISDDLTEELSSPPVIHFLPVNVPLYTPAVTANMVNAAIESRILKPNPIHPIVVVEDLRIQRAFFGMNVQMLEVITSNPYLKPMVQISWDENYDEWLSNYPSAKRPMMNNARIKIIGGAKWPTLVAIKHKHDESLPRIDGTLKPRALFDVDPMYQARLGPVVLQMTKYCKQLFNCTDFYFDAWRGAQGLMDLRFTWGPGMLDRELDVWAQEAEEWVNTTDHERYAIICAGDDSLVLAKNGRLLVGDMTMYDASQHEILQSAVSKWWRALGATDEDLKVHELMRSCKGRVSYPRRLRADYNVFIDFTKRRQRMTGGPDTTFSNTITNFVSWVWALSQGSSVTQIPGAFAQLGFTIKLKEVDWDHANFLKGAFPLMLRNDILQRVWVPLPSRFIKLGKTMTNPRELFPDQTFEQATNTLAAALASNYAPYKDIPLIGAFIQRYSYDIPALDRLRFKEHAPYFIQFHHLRVDGPPIAIRPDPSHDLFSFFTNYYQLGDLRALTAPHNMIMTSSLFTFIQHPTFAVLVLNDY